MTGVEPEPARRALTPRERMTRVWACQKADRVPFVPAIYEHKAWLLGKTPSEVACSEDLIVEAVRREYETYRPDLLTVGLDIYNVEAEALGGRLGLYPGAATVPRIARPLCATADEVRALKAADPEAAGRMPLFLRAAERIHEELGREVHVRGAISGPFSLAAELLGFENALIATKEDPDLVQTALEKAEEVVGAYAEAYLRRGLGVVIFDSRAAPPLCPPDVFADQLLPFYLLLAVRLEDAGAEQIPLILGGNTTSIAELLVRTRATQFLCDYDADFAVWRHACAKMNKSFRANLDPRVIHQGTVPEVIQMTRALLEKGRDVPGFILGTGVCAYDTPRENILAVRELVESYR
jgi:uroporphyrinogen decarboxylase